MKQELFCRLAGKTALIMPAVCEGKRSRAPERGTRIHNMLSGYCIDTLGHSGIPDFRHVGKSGSFQDRYGFLIVVQPFHFLYSVLIFRLQEAVVSANRNDGRPQTAYRDAVIS